jgi:hypothetical protein
MDFGFGLSRERLDFSFPQCTMRVDFATSHDRKGVGQRDRERWADPLRSWLFDTTQLRDDFGFAFAHCA